jgi:uncharacterized protein
MYKITIVFLFILSASRTYAQTSNSNVIITEGTSKIKVKPDIASFVFSVEKNDLVEKNALRKLNIEVDKLITTLNKLGFSNSEIKVSEYDLSSSDENSDSKKGKLYTAKNSLALHFKFDSKAVDAIYGQIENTGLTDVDIAFDAILSDSLIKITQAQLIQLAIFDAKEKAQNIATGLNVKLGEVKNVTKDYGNRTDYTFMANSRGFFKGETELVYRTSFYKLQPNEKELIERVTITFEIVK